MDLETRAKQISTTTWTIPIFNQLLKTRIIACGDGYGNSNRRHTVVEVPDTPFQLKVSFFGNSVIQICYLTSISCFMKWSLNFRLDPISSNVPMKDFMICQGNTWQCCMRSKIGFDLNKYTTEPLHLSFKLMVSHAAKTAVCSNIPLPYIQLSEDLGNFLTDDSFSDVTMKSGEGIEFRAHKTVLAARSKVLRAHFEHNTKESITNVVETPWETEVLRDVLTFVYTDKAPRVKDAPDKLLIAADYYQLDRLKSLCAEALNNRLTVENAVDTLQLAELYSLSSLRLSTLNYIQNDRLKLVKQTRGWKNIQSVQFIQRIYDFIFADQIDKSDILAAALKEIE
ncbi:Roadkill [Operophtera brumata]|uniref:Roadkill n=1 Tax=Operophtera brumata TaxID=104452 RepID=A0A0L7KZ63_OPEBR|nr:Roadkill [Operophtera brumata]